MRRNFTTKRFLSAVVFISAAIFFYLVSSYTPPVKNSVVPKQTSSSSTNKSGIFELLPQTQIGPTVSSTPSSTSYVLVTKVIDGDTIELETGEKVRYIGMNTPEIHHPKKSVECFGKEAAKRNEELVLNKKVHLVKDVSETDRYKRLLRYVYLADGRFVNLELVEEGYAYVDTFPPDVKFAEVFKKTMEEARDAKRGLWKMCK